jgi:hypothetical protein
MSKCFFFGFDFTKNVCAKFPIKPSFKIKDSENSGKDNGEK